ncbi:related to SCP160 protein [Cephalotrichum gorgonifer]|uniref:Related to SCP160 protein n=1 Tax=Cephalotrichum gorgonifer TaxID=2041049 RepID=A0AAE8SXM5_9PEZI|nr:related to SCP160 protein [Cephalotrichum gorgonifer]
MSAAERMAQEHAISHQAFVETPDEESEPPIFSTGTNENEAPVPSWGPSDAATATGTGKKNKAPLDTQSHELFPELGASASATSKGKGPANAIPTWGSKSGGKDSTNGAAARPVVTPAVTLPGRNVESITIEPHHILPKQELRRPIPDVIRDINRKSRAKITMFSAANGRLKFDATGPQDVAQQALKDLVRQIGIKTTVPISIPQSCRAHIIGKQGSTIKGIQERTGARINLPKLEDTQAGLDDDDDAEIIVNIEGNTLSAASARDEILKIVNERSANTQTKVRGIPAEFYPFIAGPRNARVQGLEEENGVKINVPRHRPFTSQPIPTVPNPGEPLAFSTEDLEEHISLAGDRASVQRARAAIEQLAEDLRRQLKLEQFSVQHGRHQFIIGKQGIPIEEFFADTGCTLLLPLKDDEDLVTVIGPPEKVPDALERAMDLAVGMQCSNIDISRFHRGAPDGAAVHARNVTRYLRKRKEIARLESTYQTHINTPFSEHGALPWEIYSRDGKNSIRAQSEITAIMNGHPPSRIASVPVDPFFHAHISKDVAPRVRENFGVHVVVPEASETGVPVVLVYEGQSDDSSFEVPKTAPSKDEVKLFQKSLEEARKHIIELVSQQEQIDAVSIDVPLKFHERLRRFIKGEQDRRRSEQQIPIRVSSAGTKVTLRGPASAVSTLATKIGEWVEQAKEDEKERGFTLSFDFPQKFANHLIGKGGSNIRDLRDKFDVEIQVQDGKVELKGPKAKAEAAKSHILSLGRNWSDETSHSLKIDSKFHRELIGKEGVQINRLQDRYKVLIFFPRSAKAAASSEDQGTDASSDAGSKPKRQQGPDEVVIRGPSRGADGARDELFSLYQYLKDNSFTATVTIQQKQVPSLIGQGGSALEDLRLSTGAKIDIPADRGAETVEVLVKGTKEQVAAAKKIIEQKKSVFDDTVVKTIDVDRKHHRSLIGPGGSNLRNLVVSAGGSDDRRELARTIQFPKQDADGNSIKVEGPSSVVDKIIEAIQAKVTEWESQVTEVIDVPTDKHRSLIGRGGDVKRQMEAKFEVSIDIPRQGEGKTGVKISGLPEKVQAAKKHIETLVKEQEGETVQVPRAAHHAVSNNGQFFRKLRNDWSVTVDHAGQAIPAKPETTRANGGSLPLITDDEDTASDAHSWTVVQSVTSGEEGDIPWVLRGSAENVEKAKKAIQAALEQASKHDTTGLLVLPDPSTNRFIIGPGGSKVKSIRSQSGCKITVPRENNGEPIEVVGSKEGVEKAKELILAAVREGLNGSA